MRRTTPRAINMLKVTRSCSAAIYLALFPTSFS